MFVRNLSKAIAAPSMGVTMDENESDPEPERTAGFGAFLMRSCPFLKVSESTPCPSSDVALWTSRGVGRSLREEPVRLLVDREDHHIGRLQAIGLSAHQCRGEAVRRRETGNCLVLRGLQLRSRSSLTVRVFSFAAVAQCPLK